MKRPKSFTIVPGQGTDPKRRYWNVALQNGVYVEGKHPSEFLGKCLAALEANGLDSGEGWKERVWNDVCLQNPHIPCVDGTEVEMSATWADVRRFFITLSDLIGDGRGLVDPTEQARRIAICKACPHNVHLGQCFGCGWMAQKLSELAGGRRIEGDVDVHRRGCQDCGCEISVKTAYPLNVLQKVDEKIPLKHPYHEKCWMLGN